MQTSREVVRRSVAFEGPDRLAIDFPEGYGSDFGWMSMTPSPDWRPYDQDYGPGRDQLPRDEWGALWQNIGVCKLGEVKEYPLSRWEDWSKLHIPDISEPRRWTALAEQKRRAGDRYIVAVGVALYERVHFIRGLENTWADIYEEPDRLKGLIDLLVEMNTYAIERYAAAGADGYMFFDDWGLQDRLMIAPQRWREIWKPAYRRVYEAAHRAGLQTILHSCGHIVEILDDLIDCGLDVIQMDQQANMGLELLGRRFRGRIAFWCPVDIQAVMCGGSLDEIRAYCRQLMGCLGTQRGGFLAKWYSDPVGAGHSQAAIDAMCSEFLRADAEARASAAGGGSPAA